MDKKITLVTALYDIGRGSLSNSFSRKFEHYLEKFKELLNNDYPMIIFCDESLEKFIWLHRSKENTRIVYKSLEDIKEYPHYADIQKIRNKSSWKSQASWLHDSPQSQLEFYNPIVMAKQFWLNDASIYNTFNTKYFLWVDAGITSTVNINSYLRDEKIVKLLYKTMNKMLYIAFPYETSTEIHGFKKNAIDDFAEDNVTRVVRGGIFGGTREAIASINEVYYRTLMDTLNSGYMGTEESVFTILSYKFPYLINLEMINGDGLIYTFFERLKTNKHEASSFSDEIAIYVLTYNAPKQFELWAETFEKTYPEFINSSPKYVINNSDNPALIPEYLKLFKKYHFKEIKYNNIGITGGRYEAAKHFSKTRHGYMVFFEDDMLVSNSKEKSLFGFNQFFNKNIFNNVKDILEMEELDYMKLSFDELYGNNATNWAWYHTPTYMKNTYFPTNSPKSKIDHIDSYKGIPYAVGNFFYCNWPIMFSQIGNKKMFILNKIGYTHEGAYMYRSLEKHFTNELKSGCLLASIITHDRRFDYEREKRKEC